MTLILNFPKLKGQENYQPWSKDMKNALGFSRLWDVVKEGINIFPNNLQEEEFVMEQRPDGVPQKRITKPGPTDAQALAYQADVNAWKDLNNQAMELILSMCEKKPAEVIKDEQYAVDLWAKLESQYIDCSFAHRRTKLKELRATTLSSSNNSVETYIANIRTISKDLKRMGAPIDDWILVYQLLENMDGKFPNFIHHLLTSLVDIEDFDKVGTLLLKWEYTDQALPTSTKRFRKEPDGKEAKGNSNSGHRGRNSGRGRGGKNNSNDSNDRLSKNPHSTNYRGGGDLPECTECTPKRNGRLKKHWPLDCWTLHKDKIPEKYRTNTKDLWQ